jgi:carboxypeptidase Q
VTKFSLKVLAALTLAVLPAAASAQMLMEKVDLAAAQKIRDEGLNRSRIDDLASYLTDVIGARLTNSPGSRKANEWAAQTFRSWSLANVAIEPWDTAFGRGWELVSYSGRILEPWIKPLDAYPQAWSGNTLDARGRPGPVTCPVVILEVRDTADLARYRGKLKGACVLRGAPATIGPEFSPAERRISLEDLVEPAPAGQGAQRGGRPATTGGPSVLTLTNQLLRAEQPAAVLQSSGWTYGIIRSGGHFDGRAARDSIYNPVPHMLVAHEQYGVLYRVAKRGLPVRVELNLQTRFYDDNRVPANVVAEIPGTDKADELVMLGAHFDSWHGGTGATDNAAGSVVMMEAVRILKTLGLPMRRTVRIALWTGEEQGLIGSSRYLRIHRSELPKISAYLNLDNGTGKIRGVYSQSNAAAAPIFEQIFSPFRDLGVLAVRAGNTGSTDHMSFDRAGVPGFNFLQDPIEYSVRSHHSNVDTYERLLIDDLKQAATVVAWTVFHLANREELMPRKNPQPAVP